MASSSSPFDKSFAHVVGVEGGYSDHPDDRGGKTKYGITEAVAREEGWTGSMRDLPLDFAKSVYRKRYWNVLRLDEVAAISESVAHELFDTGVNMGTGTAGKFLQRSLNALNRQGTDYADISVDGAVGPKTVAALRAFFAKRGKAGESVLLKALNCLQGARYIELAEQRQANESFVFGWLSNRVGF